MASNGEVEDDDDDRDVGLLDSSNSEAGDAIVNCDLSNPNLANSGQWLGDSNDFDNDDHDGSVGSRHPSTDEDC